MDTSNFRSAAELGITKDERQKLIELLPRLENADADSYFDMNSWDSCIVCHAGLVPEGWPHTFAATFRGNWPFSQSLAPLVCPSIYRFRNPQSQKDAAKAIRKFLEGSQKPWEFAEGGVQF